MLNGLDNTLTKKRCTWSRVGFDKVNHNHSRAIAKTQGSIKDSAVVFVTGGVAHLMTYRGGVKDKKEWISITRVYGESFEMTI
jgi:hypothetical protein